jgi:WD40 repeat protein
MMFLTYLLFFVFFFVLFESFFFSFLGSQMSLVAVLRGHSNDVNCIRWFGLKDQWITGGDDNTIRVWARDVFIFIFF